MDKETNGHLYIANDNLKRIADALEKNEFGLGAVSQLGRIADAMEDILRLVKKDMEPKKK